MFIGVHLWLFLSSVAIAQENITVAVASSYYEKAKEYAAQFEKKHDVSVRLVSGSTGRLLNQIKQGAPFDIFIAAGSQSIDLDKPYQAMGYGYLAIQVGNNFATNLKRLAQADIHNIAIANPQTAPFGTVAKQVLEKQGLWKGVQPKLVYAQNAMQASMMVNQGLVDAAFVPVQTEQGSIVRIPYTAYILISSELSQAFVDGLTP